MRYETGTVKANQTITTMCNSSVSCSRTVSFTATSWPALYPGVGYLYCWSQHKEGGEQTSWGCYSPSWARVMEWRGRGVTSSKPMQQSWHEVTYEPRMRPAQINSQLELRENKAPDCYSRQESGKATCLRIPLELHGATRLHLSEWGSPVDSWLGSWGTLALSPCLLLCQHYLSGLQALWGRDSLSLYRA